MEVQARDDAGVGSLAVRLGGLTLTNPVMPASGCFGPELGEIIPLDYLGALVTKTDFSGIRSGNPAHRLTEAAGGMVNAVGIPSPGTPGFIKHALPGYLAPRVPLIISIGGLALDEYWTVTEELFDVPYAALEVNVSCPNLEHGGLEIGADPRQVEAVIKGVVERTDRPVIAKLTPNVSRIDDIARDAEVGGAVAVTVANTFVGMAIELRHRRPVLGSNTGGLSGPAIKPLALRLVWQVARAVEMPVIGCGGIATARDALEFLVAGATAVQVGTATFTRPDSMIRILSELPGLVRQLGAHNDLARTKDARYKVNPPLRTAHDVAAVQAALVDGTIDVIATDHAPHLRYEKAQDWCLAPMGIPGLETALAVVANVLVGPGGLTWDDVAQRMSCATAALGGIDAVTDRPLREGDLATFCLVDPGHPWTVDGAGTNRVIS